MNPGQLPGVGLTPSFLGADGKPVTPADILADGGKCSGGTCTLGDHNYSCDLNSGKCTYKDDIPNVRGPVAAALPGSEGPQAASLGFDAMNKYGQCKPGATSCKGPDGQDWTCDSSGCQRPATSENKPADSTDKLAPHGNDSKCIASSSNLAGKAGVTDPGCERTDSLVTHSQIAQVVSTASAALGVQIKGSRYVDQAAKEGTMSSSYEATRKSAMDTVKASVAKAAVETYYWLKLGGRGDLHTENLNAVSKAVEDKQNEINSARDDKMGRSAIADKQSELSILSRAQGEQAARKAKAEKQADDLMTGVFTSLTEAATAYGIANEAKKTEADLKRAEQAAQQPQLPVFNPGGSDPLGSRPNGTITGNGDGGNGNSSADTAGNNDTSGGGGMKDLGPSTNTNDPGGTVSYNGKSPEKGIPNNSQPGAPGGSSIGGVSAPASTPDNTGSGGAAQLAMTSNPDAYDPKNGSVGGGQRGQGAIPGGGAGSVAAKGGGDDSGILAQMMKMFQPNEGDLKGDITQRVDSGVQRGLAGSGVDDIQGVNSKLWERVHLAHEAAVRRGDLKPLY